MIKKSKFWIICAISMLVMTACEAKTDSNADRKIVSNNGMKSDENTNSDNESAENSEQQVSEEICVNDEADTIEDESGEIFHFTGEIMEVELCEEYQELVDEIWGKNEYIPSYVMILDEPITTPDSENVSKICVGVRYQSLDGLFDSVVGAGPVDIYGYIDFQGDDVAHIEDFFGTSYAIAVIEINGERAPECKE